MKHLLALLIVMVCVAAMYSLPATQDDHEKQMKKDDHLNTNNAKPAVMAETLKNDDDKLKYHHASGTDKLHKRDVPVPIEPQHKHDEVSMESMKPKPQVEDLSDIVYGDKPNSKTTPVS